MDNTITFNKKSVVEFILDMRERLKSTVELAESYAEEQKQKRKTWYDKRARERSYEPGQEILAFLPLTGNPLKAKFCGPYRVLQKLGPVDYLIDTPNRRKLQRVCHVNLLNSMVVETKKYFHHRKTLFLSVAPLQIWISVSPFSHLLTRKPLQALTPTMRNFLSCNKLSLTRY